MEQEIKILLISGAEHTGKTDNIGKLVMEFFKGKNFDVIEVVRHNDRTLTPVKEEEKNNLLRKKRGEYSGNYFAILQSKDKQKKIIISTASDDVPTIDIFKEYVDKNPKCYFIIAPIRNVGDKNREYFINVIGKIAPNIDFKKDVIEIPLTKINENDYKIIKNLYKKNCFELITGILNLLFFNKQNEVK